MAGMMTFLNYIPETGFLFGKILWTLSEQCSYLLNNFLSYQKIGFMGSRMGTLIQKGSLFYFFHVKEFLSSACNGNERKTSQAVLFAFTASKWGIKPRSADKQTAPKRRTLSRSRRFFIRSHESDVWSHNRYYFCSTQYTSPYGLTQAFVAYHLR